MERRAVAASLAGLVLLAGGCATTDEPTATDRAPATAATILAEHGVEQSSAVRVIEELDAMPLAERPADLMASVRPGELVVTDGGPETSLPIPEDRFYLSVAPYVDRTHECFHHSLTTCRGELAGEQVEVRITTSDGEVLVDRTRTTWANGFVGFWLPSDVEGTIEVTYGDRSGRTDFATRADSPTCLTTLRLA